MNTTQTQPRSLSYTQTQTLFPKPTHENSPTCNIPSLDSQSMGGGYSAETRGKNAQNAKRSGIIMQNTVLATAFFSDESRMVGS